MTASLNHAVHHVHHPGGTLPARCALATGFVFVEVGKPSDGRHNVGALVHDNHGTSSETSSSILEGIVVHAIGRVRNAE